MVLKVKQKSDELLHYMMGPLDIFSLAQLQNLGEGGRERERTLGDTGTMTDTQDFCAVCSMGLNFITDRPNFKKTQSYHQD